LYSIPTGFQPEDLSAVVAAVEGTHLYAPTRLALATGARRGELLALKWADIELEDRTLSITKTIASVGEALKIKPPKSDHSVRAISLPGFALRVLKVHRAEQAALRLKIEETYRDNEQVFCEPDGSL
jgi:integrase